MTRLLMVVVLTIASSSFAYSEILCTDQEHLTKVARSKVQYDRKDAADPISVEKEMSCTFYRRHERKTGFDRLRYASKISRPNDSDCIRAGAKQAEREHAEKYCVCRKCFCK